MIAGKTMIQRVWDRCKLASTLDELYILTDNDKIEEHCINNGMRVIRVDDDVHTGTDRCEIASKLLLADIFVNIQGDEPLIDPNSIDALVDNFNYEIGVVNAYCDITEDYKIKDENVVKVALDKESNAMYYSRTGISDYQQLGLYAFTTDKLSLFANTEVGECEKRERVEMFRFIENGNAVKMVKVDDCGISVDTPNDIKLVELRL